MANKTFPKQFKNSDPYLQRIYQFDSRERDTYINRSPNRLLKSAGNDVILRGFYPRTVEFDGTELKVEICKGVLIQDTTLIETNEDRVASIDTTSYDLDNGFFIIHTDYEFDKLIENNNRFEFVIQYISKDGSYIHPYGWNFERNRIYIAILEFDGEDFVFSDYYDMMVDGKRYYIRGINNFNLINLTYDALRHYDSFILDTIQIISSLPPILSGEVYYEDSNWTVADHANLIMFANDEFYDPRYVIVKPIILDHVINNLKYNIYLGDKNRNLILQEIDSGLDTQENQQNPNIGDIAQHPTYLFNEYQMISRYHNLFLVDPLDKRNLCDPFLFPPQPYIEPEPAYDGFGEYGYVCNGFHIMQYSTLTRFTFPLNAGISEKVGEMSGSRYSCAGCNSSTHGYMCNGKNLYDPVNGFTKSLSNVERFEFPLDSGTSIHLMNLNIERSNSCSFNNSKYGYVAGGSGFSSIERFTFPGQSGGFIAETKLSKGISYPSANNSSLYGYVCGGLIGFDAQTSIDRYTFPLHVGTSLHMFSLHEERYASSANNSTQYGYVHQTYQDTNHTIERFNFSLNANSQNIGNLNYRKRYTSANNSSTHGFICGGQNMNNSSTDLIERFEFSLDDGSVFEVGYLNGSRWKTCAIDTVDFATVFI